MNEQELASITYHWEIGPLIQQLRDLRIQSLEQRQRRHNPPRLPSRGELRVVLEGLATVLFPNRLGLSKLTEESLDYYVGYTLDTLLRELCQQIFLELQFFQGQEATHRHIQAQAAEITQQFAATLPTIRQLLETDLQAAYEGDPAARTPDEVLVCYPGITAVIHHRLAHELYRLGVPMVARIIAELAHSATGIDIHPGAQIGHSFFIDHGTGVVIGETSVIGNHVRLYQAVTLGAKRFLKAEDGTLLKGNARHPIVEDGVVIYAGATILGRITIGHHSTIGGNVWLTHSVPPYSHIAQASIRSELFSDGAGI